jgi:hypothetical protein
MSVPTLILNMMLSLAATSTPTKATAMAHKA